jgi:DNA (cytosine-5)-methyltransferase 1
MKNENIDPIIECIDLFCGVGGLTHGLIQGGISVIGGIDLDPTCRFPYEHNNNAVFIERDIHDISANDINTLFGNTNLTLLAGCAPCQPFSKYSRKVRKLNNDSKWQLVLDFGRLARDSQPDFVTMENVPELLNHEVFEDFLKDLENYKVWFDIVDCTQYGVPQTRKQLVLLASKHGEIELLTPEEFGSDSSTVRQKISHLPSISAGETHPDDPLHRASGLSDLNLRRIRASKPGGTWRDWDDSLLAKCHRKLSGQYYSSVYGRMKWDTASPTITTQCFGYGNGRFGHPEQDRAISLREATILQTFPENYLFTAPNDRITFDRLGRLIGNAVPVRIGEVIAKSIIKHTK